MSLVGAIASALGSMVAGRLADDPTETLLLLLGLCVVGGAVIDTVAKTIWATICDRAEGRLRSDLLDAAMAQPLSELSEQAVGEVLDRIDDDTWEVGQLMRWGVWQAARTLLASGPLWVVASLTWWPAAFLFPVTAVVTFLSIRRLLPEVSEKKVIEEAAWTDHAASTEEGVAARDDLRTSLGQAHVLRRNAHLASVVHRTLDAVLAVEVRITRRSGGLLHGALAAVGVVGVALVLGGNLSTARLVTLFLVTTMFVGGVDMLARHLPDLQEGFGAVLRLRGMMAAPAEPTGGRPVPDGPLDVEFRHLDFSLRHRHLRAARRRPAAGCRAHLRPGGPHGLGQVHPRLPALAGGRAAAGLGVPRRGRRPRPRPPAAALGGGRGHPAHRGAGGHPRRQHHPLRRRAPRAGRGSRRRARPRPTGSPASPTASTPSSARAARACPRARSSSSPSPACWCAT